MGKLALAAIFVLAICSFGWGQDVPPIVEKIVKARLERIVELKEKAKDDSAATRNAARLEIRRLETVVVGPSRLEFSTMRAGDVGRMRDDARFKIGQLIDENTALVFPSIATLTSVRDGGSYSRKALEPIMFRGPEIKGLADGAKLDLDGTYAVSGTESYTTVAGAKATCYVVEPIDAGRFQAKIKAMLKADK